MAMLAGLGASGTGAAQGTAAPGYHVQDRIEIGGKETGYDYLRVDEATRRLFVAHGSRVEVLDADTGKRVGQLEGLSGAHGVDFDPVRHLGFATSGIDRSVLMFDPASLQTLKRIKYLGLKPDDLAYDPASDRVFVVNGGGTGDLSVIDPASGSIVDTIDLAGGKLEEIAVDGMGRAFINDEEKNVVHVIDTRTGKRVADWPLAPGDGPTGLAIDRAHHRLFAACGNRLLAVLDADTGRLVETTAIGPEPDGAAFDSRTGRVFTSNRDGTVTVLAEARPGHYEAVQTVTTASGARTLALDAATGRLFLPTSRFGAAPPATPAEPHPRAPVVPESFAIVVVAP